jgi:hypothetical protein
VESQIEKPIIILGAARSGTYLMSRSLDQHPDVAYASEPNYIWKAYNASLGHDMIPASRATEPVCAYIRHKFNQMRIAQGKPRFCEKTPANGLRLPFVLEVFPDAKLIHIVRDGRQVAVSSRRKFRGNVNKITTGSESGPSETTGKKSAGGFSNLRHVIRRTRMRLSQGIPLLDLPHYAPKAVDSALGMIGLKQQFLWGPEFPGMRKMMRTHSLIEICAIQWQMSVEGVLNVVSARPGVDYYEVKFDRLIAENEKVTREVFDFAELPQPDHVETLRPRGFDRSEDPFHSELDEGERQIVMDRISGTLARLGFISEDQKASLE